MNSRTFSKILAGEVNASFKRYKGPQSDCHYVDSRLPSAWGKMAVSQPRRSYRGEGQTGPLLGSTVHFRVEGNAAASIHGEMSEADLVIRGDGQLLVHPQRIGIWREK